MIREKVVEADFAVDRGPDHGPPVGSLEVSLHNLVEFAVTEHHGLQLETFCPQQVNGLLIFIRKSKNRNITYLLFSLVYGDSDYLSVSLSHLNSNLSNLRQYLARESIM